MSDDFRTDLEATDADALLPLARRLSAERPVPRAAFRGELRRRLTAGGGVHRPRWLWLRVGSSFGAGAALLAIAALSAVGSGPLAG